MRSVKFDPKSFEQFLEWADRDFKTFEKIRDLIKEVQREPFKGEGKPEPLKGELKGYWSRRITHEHRLVYKVSDNTITIIRCYGHYE